jgi:hypothetical protein
VAYRIALAGILVTGVAAVLRVWWAGRLLWNDETAVALNLRHLGWRGLTGGLQYFQVAPVGWLWVEKALRELLGESERVLRLPSVLAALTMVLLTPLVARRAAGRPAALVAALLVVCAPMLLTYAGELKQYAVEAAVALVLLLLAERVPEVDPTAGRWRPVAVWVAVTSVAVFVSLSAVLVLGGAVAGLLVVLLRAGRRRHAVTVALASVPAAAVSGLLIVRRLAYPLMPGQGDYFRDGTPPAHSGPGGVLAWLPRMWAGFVQGTLQWRFPGLVLLLVVLGLVALLVRGRAVWAAMLGGVFLAAVGAAALRGLPLADRVALYLVAPTVVLVSAGIDALARAALTLARAAPTSAGRRPGGPLRRPAAVLAALALVAVAAGQAVAVGPAVEGTRRQAVDPLDKDPSGAALGQIRRRMQPGDLVLVYWFSSRMVAWYGTRAGVSGVPVRLYAPDAPECGSARLRTTLSGIRRVFYVQGRPLSSDPGDYLDRVGDRLGTFGRVTEVHRFDASTGWLLVDLSAGPDAGRSARPAVPGYSCLNRW